MQQLSIFDYFPQTSIKSSEELAQALNVVQQDVQQLSLIDYFSQTSSSSTTEKGRVELVQAPTSHKDSRSKEYAYDCGEKLQGAKKHLSALVKFSGEWQKVIEQDPSEAYQLVSKDALLDNFKAESLKEKGFTSEAAYGIKLLLNKVSQRPADDVTQRRYFIQAVKELQLRLAKATTEQLFRDIVDQIKKEIWKAYYSHSPKKVEIDPELMNYRFWLSLGKRVSSLFIGNSRSQPYKALLNKAFSSEEGKEWNWANVKKKGDKDTSKEKNQWERRVPEEVIRLSNKPSGVSKPEDLIEEYGFRGIQFGNWVEDAAGRYHVLSSGNAWADLADILQIPRKSISLYGKLGLAFGARGSGKASAHFEPTENLMNLTKFRGGGSQCHEWAHALDFNLYSFSHDYSNGKQMALSGNRPGGFLGENISYAFDNLMKMIKEGKGLMRIVVPNPLPDIKMNYVQGIKDYLVRNKYDINKAMVELSSSRYRLKSKDWKEIGFMYCNMLIQEGMEVPTEYFVPTNYSSFYLDACERGAYWKRDHELFARAFESWIEDELAERGITNSYLVTGTRYGGPYPEKDERKSINDAFRKWWKVLSDAEILHNNEFWN